MFSMSDLNDVKWLEPEIREAVIRFVYQEQAPLLVAESVGHTVQRAMLLAISEARAVCLEFPNTQMTAATNNWAIGRRIADRLIADGLKSEAATVTDR